MSLSRDIFSAIANNNIHDVQHLIDQGADINAQNSDGDTPLIMAVIQDNKSILDCILEQNPNIHHKNKKGEDALISAILFGHIDGVISDLIKYGAQFPSKAHEYAWHGDYEQLKNFPITSFENDSAGNSVLHYAACGNHLVCVQLLIDMGIDISQKNTRDRTAAFCAARLYSPEVLACILSKATNSIHDVDNKKGNILHAAINSNHFSETQSWLIKNYPALLSTKNNLGLTPFLFAIIRNNFKAVKLMVELHPLCLENKMDKTEFTPTMTALWSDNLDIFHYLHAVNPQNILVKDSHNVPPLYHFILTDNVDSAKCLLQLHPFKSYFDDAQDILGILKIVYSNNQPEMIQLIQEYYPHDVTKADEEGWTLLHHACLRGWKDTVHNLLSTHKISDFEECDTTPFGLALYYPDLINYFIKSHPTIYVDHIKMEPDLIEEAIDLLLLCDDTRTDLIEGLNRTIQLLLESGAGISADISKLSGKGINFKNCILIGTKYQSTDNVDGAILTSKDLNQAINNGATFNKTIISEILDFHISEIKSYTSKNNLSNQRMHTLKDLLSELEQSKIYICTPYPLKTLVKLSILNQPKQFNAQTYENKIPGDLVDELQVLSKNMSYQA